MVDEAHPYSTVRVVTAGGARWAFASGVLPYVPASDTDLLADAETAPARAFELLGERLAVEGFGLEDVTAVTVYLADIGWIPALNRAFAAAFSPPRPARTSVEVAALPRGARIEVDAVAVRA